jgi:hypothetical protein
MCARRPVSSRAHADLPAHGDDRVIGGVSFRTIAVPGLCVMVFTRKDTPPFSLLNSRSTLSKITLARTVPRTNTALPKEFGNLSAVFLLQRFGWDSHPGPSDAQSELRQKRGEEVRRSQRDRPLDHRETRDSVVDLAGTCAYRVSVNRSILIGGRGGARYLRDYAARPRNGAPSEWRTTKRTE